MLLDRRKIRRWAKWVALALAIIFALGFLVGGIGYGTGGFSLLDVISGAGCSETTEPNPTQTQLDQYLADIQADPTNTDAMLSAATIYESMYNQDDPQTEQYLYAAANMLQQAIDADPSLNDVYIRLADLYMNKYGSTAAYQAAVTVLDRAAQADPNNAEVYLKLGTAQRTLGNNEAAALAWQKYLQLDPNGQYADLIRQEIEDLAGQNTTTTAGTGTTSASGTTTTTTAPATTTTAPATTTTTLPPTSSTAG